MPIFGSDGNFLATNRGGVIDDLGNTIVSADTSFAASPLGIAARTQALYGISNANFNLVPPDPTSPIVPNHNDLPYWDFNNLSDGVMTATTVFDATTQTWGVQLNPGTAASGASMTLSTRSYLITDDNLALRQKALAVLSKSGTAAGTTQWNLTLDAVYYDANDTALSTAVIGTALDTGTWTSFAGTTTPGGSAINAAAQYVDLTFKLTTTAAVTGSAKATIKSLLLTTSTAATGSFLVTEYFTSSATWNVPTGVSNLYAVVGCGAGGGGAGGSLGWRSSVSGTTSVKVSGSSGGGSGAWGILRDVPLGTALSVSVGIGAGGAGGTATTRTSPQSGSSYFLTGGAGGGGATTTVGSFLSLAGGGGGIAGTANNTTAALGAPAGGTAGAITSSYYGLGSVAAPAGGAGGSAAGTTIGSMVLGAGAAGGAVAAADRVIYPYNPVTAFGAAGGTSIPGGSYNATALGTAGTANAGTASWGGGGGGSGACNSDIIQDISPRATAFASGNGSLWGGGGGAGASFAGATPFAGRAATAGNGGAAAANSGAGGGAGGALAMSNSSSNNGNTVTSGSGGNGANGFVVIVYVA